VARAVVLVVVLTPLEFEHAAAASATTTATATDLIRMLCPPCLGARRIREYDAARWQRRSRGWARLVGYGPSTSLRPAGWRAGAIGRRGRGGGPKCPGAGLPGVERRGTGQARRRCPPVGRTPRPD